MCAILDDGLLNVEFLTNPYPTYRELQRRDPVHWSESLCAWVLTRYEDIKAAHRDPRLKSGDRPLSFMSRMPQEVQQSMRLFQEHIGNWLSNLDPPNHTRLRALVSKAFTPGVVDSLRPRIEVVVNQLIDAVMHKGQMDVVGEFAYPLPATIITELLGIPSKDRDQFKMWADGIIEFLGDTTAQTSSARRAERSATALTEYLRDIINERRRMPQDDLISKLVIVEEQGQMLSEQELCSMCNGLVVGGFETTMALIANGLVALLDNPDQLSVLRNNPSLVASAVEEVLRYESPLQMSLRLANRDFDLHGKTIKKGDRVLLALGAANRDPTEFPDPDSFDIRRENTRHLAFGHGIHFCLGAPLARLEGQIAINAVLGRLPGIRRKHEKLEWRQSLTHRHPIALWVAF